MSLEEGVMLATAHARRNYRAYEEEIASLNERVQNLVLCLAVERAITGGRESELKAWENAHPDSPMLRKSGTFSDGSSKNIGRKIFEKVFDEIMIKSGLKDPLKFRRD